MRRFALTLALGFIVLGALRLSFDAVTAAVLAAPSGEHQQSAFQITPQLEVSSEQASRLAVSWVDFLVTLQEVRDSVSKNVSIDEMLVNNRYGLTRLKSPLVALSLDQSQYASEPSVRAFLQAANNFRTLKIQETEDSFSLLRRISRARTDADLRDLPADSAVLAGQIDELWRLLPAITAELAHALVDNSRLVDGRIAYLRINSAQRKSLQKKIQTAFPTAGVKDGGLAIEVSASLLYGFLNQGFRASDEIESRR